MSVIDEEITGAKSKGSYKLENIFEESDTEKKYRTVSILSYFVVLILLGIPIWWYTTRVYRASLPLDQIYDVAFKTRKSTEFGVPLSLEYDILISFVHPDPENLHIKPDVLAIDGILRKFLEKFSIANFVIKSQWLYLTELGAVPRKVLDHYALLENQLPHVITPLESKLWSHLSPRPSLNFIVYFPHCRAPLYIYDVNNEISASNAFVSPRWGGIYIMNPDEASCEKAVFNPDSETIAATFEHMVLELFQMENATASGVREMETRRTEEMLESSKNTLKSLAQLLSEINSIVISDEVADKINVAMRSLSEAEDLLMDGDARERAMLKAKLAFQNSEEAFSHPSLLALLYFPDDQKYAIYIPLFLPVMIPVIMSLTHIRKKVSKAKKD